MTLFPSLPRRLMSAFGLALVCNSDPWTYLGPRPVRPCPTASFEDGLDLFGLRSLGTLTPAEAEDAGVDHGRARTGTRQVSRARNNRLIGERCEIEFVSSFIGTSSWRLFSGRECLPLACTW